jgi:hypothetical protein
MAVLMPLVNHWGRGACTRDRRPRPLAEVLSFNRKKVDAPAHDERMSGCEGPRSGGAIDWGFA